MPLESPLDLLDTDNELTAEPEQHLGFTATNIFLNHIKDFPHTPTGFKSDNNSSEASAMLSANPLEQKPQYKRRYNFSMDLNRLNNAVLSVPFHRRFDFGKSCFEEKEIEIMEKEAAGFSDSSQWNPNLGSFIENDCQTPAQQRNDQNAAPLGETTDRILSMLREQSTGIDSGSKESEEDFSKWLDDFLTDK